MMGRGDHPFPVFVHVFWWAPNLRDDLMDLLGRHHFDCIPRADEELIGIRFLLRNVDADFTSYTSLQVDLAPLL